MHGCIHHLHHGTHQTGHQSITGLTTVWNQWGIIMVISYRYIPAQWCLYALYVYCIYNEMQKLPETYLVYITRVELKLCCTWSKVLIHFKLCQIQLHFVLWLWLSFYLQLLDRTRKVKWCAVLIYVRLLILHKLLGFSLQQASSNGEQQTLNNRERKNGGVKLEEMVNYYTSNFIIGLIWRLI